MKTRFLALAALVLGLAACQTEPEGLNANVGGEVDTTITVSLPETTRAADSAEGAFKNLVNSDEYTIRYIFQVFYNGYESGAARQVIYSDGNTVSFPVRLVPGRDYNFVAWADVVPQAGKTLDVLGEYNKESDFRYNTETLKAVTFKGDWLAMDETFDAYTDAQTIEYYGTTSINLNLTRPFAKLRVMTTDMVELGNLQIVPEGVTVEYTVPVYKSFDVTAQAAKTDGASTHTFTYNLSEVQEYTATETTSTLFTNYLFGAENGIVKFTMDVKDNTSAAERIKYNNFNTDIPVQRNYLTTISGNILTDGNNVKVDIVNNGAFEGEKEWPEEGDSAQELAYAAMFGGEVTLTEDIAVTESLTIVEGANVVINLNGKTITGASVKGEGAIIENNGTLTLVGGTIKNTETNGDAVINNNGELVLDGVKIEGAPIGTTNYPNYAVYTSGKLTVENETQIISDRGALYMKNGADVTINGGNFAVTDAIGTRVMTAHLIYAYGSSSKLTINDGSFAMNIANGGGTSVICPSGATIKVYGGNFFHAPTTDVQSGCFQNYMGYGAPVDVYGGVFNDDTVTKSGNLAAGYKAIAKDGKYYVVAEEVDAVATTGAELNEALANGGDVVMTEDVKVASNETGSNGYGATGISQTNGGTIDGNGNDISVNAWGTWDSAINTTGGTIKNINVTGGMRGIFVNHNSTNCSKVILENVTIDGTVYTISCDQGTNNGLEATNSTFNGWTSYAATIGDVKFTNCSFGEGQGYAYCRPYAPTEFVNCDFAVGYEIDAVAPVTFKNCTIGGVALTVENIDQLGSLNNKKLYHNDKFVSVAKTAITNKDGVRYEGDAFASGYMENALWFNNYVFDGNAAIFVNDITYSAIVIENCSGEFKNDVITINNNNNSVMILQNLDFTIAEGKKLIKSENKIYQVFMANITINGEKMTQTTIGKYLENVEWYQVVEEI